MSITVCVLYNLWTLIVRQSFPELQERGAKFWFFFDYTSDTFVILDILVQFRTGYLEQGKRKKKTNDIPHKNILKKKRASSSDFFFFFYSHNEILNSRYFFLQNIHTGKHFFQSTNYRKCAQRRGDIFILFGYLIPTYLFSCNFFCNRFFFIVLSVQLF